MAIHFPDFNCVYQTHNQLPLVVTPKASDINFIDWAKEHQANIAAAIKECGAIVFSGFGLKKEQFSEAFEAATGFSPSAYRGDTPRDEVMFNVYKSTAVADGHALPLHQEVAGGARQDMPKIISFFCALPPAKGTGRTLLGNVREISEAIQRLFPDIWQLITTHQLTYTSRYLPDGSLRSRWIRLLNPSHASVNKMFGVTERKAVEQKCSEANLSCSWDGKWAVVSRGQVPATIDVEGVTLFCNQIHLDKLNPALCGGLVNYTFARLLLYPTSRSCQFDVKCDDGTEIAVDVAQRLLNVLKDHEVGRDWEEGDLMLVDNVTTMHGKSPHRGPREILVAMGGSVN